MRPFHPAGFVVLSGCSFLCACVMALGLADGVEDLAHPLAGRFALATTGALALVTAEALFFVRPWAFSASLAFAASFAATILVTARSTDDFLVIATVVVVPVLIALMFVYNGLRSVRTITPGPQRIRVP
jgi:uncharacterized membrane protein